MDIEEEDKLRPIENIPDEESLEETMPQSTHHHRCGGECEAPRGKLHCFNWLEDVPGGYADDDMVEVQFKNTRKGFYKNSTNIQLSIGDWVAVEASPGHDIGQVTMVGALVRLQMRKANLRPDAEIRRVFRIAKPADLQKFEEAKARENDTMIRSRKIAEELGLNMKIGDVEYQGDGSKAIFYYIADERVDFRQLIRVLADAFKVRIEMKQIGARQEAGRIGGIGPCGRPLCCASWMTNFVSVSTSAARYQDISLNPQKLAGQCAKLKCCLNFEADAYVECVKRLPSREIRLETADATYFHFKADIFKREITYSTDKSVPANLVTISAERAFEVIAMNKRGEKPLQLSGEAQKTEKPKGEYADLLGQDGITRFDKKKKKKKGNKGGQKQNQPQRTADQPASDQPTAQPDADNSRKKAEPNPQNTANEANPQGGNPSQDGAPQGNQGDGNQQGGRKKQWRKFDRRKDRNRGDKPQPPQGENG